MKNKSAGKYNKSLILQKWVSYQDDELNTIEEYQDITELKGSVNGMLRNAEMTIAGALGAKSPKRIEVRYRPFITRDMRFTLRNGKGLNGEQLYRVFNILDINNVEEKNRTLEILCEEVELNS